MTPGIGPTLGRRLLDHFGGPERILAAKADDLAAIRGMKRPAALALASREAEPAARREIDRCAELSISLVPLHDPRYSPLLRHIADPPAVLWVQGDAMLLAAESLAVVGSRSATSYGLGVAKSIASQMATRGICIVSGLALGIDTAAHRGCLRAGGKTIAVLACGLDRTYPPANRRLRGEILAKNGLIVSECPLGTAPDAFRFPARNRIISGLCKGVLVVEAAAQSGSLITANMALEQGREVFAIPGRIDSGKSAGSHRILQQGAKLVHSLDDIVEEIPGWRTPHGPAPETKNTVQASHGQKAAELSPGVASIFALLEAYPCDIDTIIRRSGRPARDVSEALLLLELAGLIESLPGNQYRRA